jgi:ubiquinone/menaquinone biosynthesis C-methylase UbiE
MTLASRLHGTRRHGQAAQEPSTSDHAHGHAGNGHDGRGHAPGHGSDGHAHPPGNADTSGFTLDHIRHYDTSVDVFFGGRRAAVFGRLVRLSGAAPGDRVLDVGCGTGYLTSLLAESVAPEGSAAGVDASAAMVDEARRVRSSAGATYAVGAAERLEFDDGAFDVVTSSLMLHHLPADLRGRALLEMRRVLRPGGRLLIAEFRPPRSRLGRRVISGLASPAMAEDQRQLLPGLIREAGFADLRTGDLRPWITYATALRGD